MPFANRVRLPFYLSRPQFPVDEDVYLKANGTRRVLKSIVSKEYEATTDYMPQSVHERLAIALRHDSVKVEGEKVEAYIRINGAYAIEWQDFMDYPVAMARFKALEEAFVARNTKCETCEPAASPTCDAPDFLPGQFTLEEIEPYNIRMTANWNAPGGGEPTCGYDWKIMINHYGMAQEVSSGNTAGHQVIEDGLYPASNYDFMVRSNCCFGAASIWVIWAFTTPEHI